MVNLTFAQNLFDENAKENKQQKIESIDFIKKENEEVNRVLRIWLNKEPPKVFLKSKFENRHSGKINLEEYPQILSFLGDRKNPFGNMHPDAPIETKQFGKLVGLWKAEDTVWVNGEWKCCWSGVWAFKYTVDGFGIQDYYVQKKEDFPPPPRAIKRDTNLTLIRVFDPKNKIWNIARISNGGKESGGSNFATFTAIKKDSEIIMSPRNTESRLSVRMIFYGLERDSFKWRLEISQDKGRTWKKRFLIKGRRMEFEANEKNN